MALLPFRVGEGNRTIARFLEIDDAALFLEQASSQGRRLKLYDSAGYFDGVWEDGQAIEGPLAD